LPLISLLIYFLLRDGPKYNLPPGEVGLPLFGFFTKLKPSMSEALLKLGKQYGPIFTVKIGQKTIFVLRSYEAIKEALVNQADNFAGRIQDKFFDYIKRDSGVIGSDGESWKLKRRNALHILRDFGFGKEGSKEVIQKEIEDTFAIIDGAKGSAFDTKTMFNNATSNIICAISMNERPAYTDAKFKKVLDCFDKLTSGSIADALPLFFPFLNKVPFIMNFLNWKSKRVEYFFTSYGFIREKLNEHRKTFDPNQEPRDFMDAMLLMENEAKKEPDYSKDNYDMVIIRIIFELFLAGTDTTATTLGWFTALMAAFPKVQAKVQAEIDEFVGRDGQVKMEHRKMLHYTTAVIDEVQRFASIATFAIAHRNFADAKIFGFDVPKDSLIFPHLYAAHHDESYWTKAYSFYPEHFLTEDGKSYKPDDHLIPFSLGRRACMGESLANMELFLISTSIIREYQIKMEKTYSEEELARLFEGSTGAVHKMNPHKLIFTRRI